MKIIPETLSAELVERGEVTKYPIYSNEYSMHSADDQVTVAMLELSPGARIKLHEHKSDNEVYFIVDTKEYLYCGKGGAHSLENTSNEIMRVLSIKGTNPQPFVEAILERCSD